jgi:hypothetical protein
MTAEHGDSAVPSRYPQNGDGEGRFDIVVRGYDRRQVDEHVGNLERTVSRLRAELQQPRTEQPRPAAHSGGQTGNSPEKITEFTGRLKSILEAAEEEAKEIRSEARNFARAEEEAARARLADLERRREGVVGELSRARSSLDALLSRFAGNSHTPPDGLPLRGDQPLPPTDKVPTSTARPEAQPTTGRAPVAPPARPAGATDAPSRSSVPDVTPRPSTGSPVSPAEPGRPAPGPSSGVENGRPIAPRPSTPSPAPTQGGPSLPPGVSPSPKPRPSPSPRPRTGAPAAHAAPEPARNGATSRDSGALKRDEDGGGPSAFGSGAR